MDDMGCMFPYDQVERNRVLKIMEDKYGKLKIQTGAKVDYIGLEIEVINNEYHIGMVKRINKF